MDGSFFVSIFRQLKLIQELAPYSKSVAKERTFHTKILVPLYLHNRHSLLYQTITVKSTSLLLSYRLNFKFI